MNNKHFQPEGAHSKTYVKCRFDQSFHARYNESFQKATDFTNTCKSVW